MKNKLITLLGELLIETDKIDQIGIKVSIMENTAFLAHPRTFGEIGNIMNNVNAYLNSPSDSNKTNIEKLIQRIAEKY